MTVDKQKAHLILPDMEKIDLDVITDNMGKHSIDIEGLRAKTGYITYDPGFMNTGSACV